jgi:hypothetical protein
MAISERITPKPAPKRVNPMVFVDLVLEDGILSLHLINRANLPAYDVRVRFKSKLVGSAGQVNIAKLPIFEKLSVLAPLKTIIIPIDELGMFFKFNTPGFLRMSLSYINAKQQSVKATFDHNTEAYVGFPTILRSR